MGIVHVPPQFPIHCPTRLAFIGEAPSDEEVDQLKPLVGPSGRIYNAVLRSSGVDRDEVLTTNLFDEEIPNDQAIQLWNEGGELAQRNRARLGRELELTDPTVIVPMGSPALFAVTGFRSILQARGAPMLAPEGFLGAGRKVLPTYHPAFVMRSWPMFPVMIGDVVKAAAEAERGPGLVFPERSITVDPTINDLASWTDRCRASPLLSVDIETAFGEITRIGFAPSVNEALVVPFVDRRRPHRSYWGTVRDEVDAWLWVKMILESDTPKLGQNYSGYDAWWLWDKRGIATVNLKHDTRLIHHAIYPELPKSLAFMGASYGTQGAWKHWGHTKGDKRDD